MTPLLEFHDVSIARGERVALDRIRLVIGAREHVAILGPNGSGKSTLIKAITRECYPLQRDGARLRILGRDTWDVFDLRSKLGIVSSDLLDACRREFRGLEIVLSGFFSSVGVWPWHEVTPAMRSKAEEALERLEIAHLAGRWVDEMSSGEQRRVMLARALVHAPQALLLDEPTASLDL
ncbi:MAG: ABC transporter ATP-binding protein, partial [Bryobacteraceae bacterium]